MRRRNENKNESENENEVEDESEVEGGGAAQDVDEVEVAGGGAALEKRCAALEKRCASQDEGVRRGAPRREIWGTRTATGLQHVQAVPQVGADEEGGFAGIGDADALLEDPVAGEGADFGKQTLVIDVGDVDAEAGFTG